MKLNEILAAMQNWKNALNQQGTQTIQNLFASINLFSFQLDTSNQKKPGQDQAYVHFYPGIHNNNLVFFSIGAFYDSQAYASSIENHIYMCNTGHGTPSPATQQGGINWQEVSQRITNWNVNHPAWINANINQLFQAFNMPQKDGEHGIMHNAFFALKNSSHISTMIADLIVEDVENTSIAYYDTVAPIPPFSPSGPLAASNFYLLSLLAD